MLAWPDLPADTRPTHFRLAVGLDERDEKTVEVFLPKSGRVLGAMELRFVSQFQVYQLPLAVADVAEVRREGLGLRLTKGSELEVFSTGENLPAAARALERPSRSVRSTGGSAPMRAPPRRRPSRACDRT